MGDDRFIGIPMVRLTVEGMRHQIIQCLSSHLDYAKVDLERAVNEAVANFDLRAELRQIVNAELRKKLQETAERAVVGALVESEGALLRYMKRAVDKAIEDDVEHALTGKRRRR